MTENSFAELPNDAPAPADVEPEQQQGAESAPAAPVETASEKEQKRFDKLTSERYRAQARAEIAERELQRLRDQLSAYEAKAKQPTVAPSPPTLEGSGFDQDKYEKAQAEYNDLLIEQRIQERLEKALAEREQRQKQSTAQRTFQQRSDEFAKSNPEYIEKVLQADELPISAFAQAEIREMELGPKVALYLVNNPEQALQIMQLPEKAQLRELGRIEERLSKAVPQSQPVSQAPPPPAKIQATEPAVKIDIGSGESDSLSDAEWMARRNKQVLRKR